MSAFSVQPLIDGKTLPMLLRAGEAGQPLGEALPALRTTIDRYLTDSGGIVFRDFALDGPDAFRAFAADFGHPLLTYEFGSTPRSQVTSGVYTSTEYPPHQHIPLHNEQAYTRDWPMKIWFYCMQPALEGGETPIADSRAIYRDMPPAIRERFTEKGVMYVRNYGNGLDVDWQQVFGTDSRSEVEAYCARHDIECEWKEDGELRTRQICQGTAQHPVTGDRVWFNQAHLFHVSNLDPEVRESLLDVVDDEADLPRNVFYGDGSTIEGETLSTVRTVLERHKISFPWQAGDVVMLDNMLTAHARAPFKGPRKVIVAMAEAHRHG
ncbi:MULTISPECIES: TauD/TfdA family dioxygenase [unclassified Bradyrhizobium]|uniref:TauD/TfdA family dioxygenase n=1 Tax=unclassified Bradyrhizobium TaxID=2631580 RepID=UPI001CD34B63|nr:MULTISPECIES: TauD/TfdA family dioxygenase [unclassified Bradyrhizobium]MCA1425788.1 TauD/TfdA family dioxygenase [Bradyrhizobium sp. NBAIM16]MCA1503149.1 TauD/TfdA family dioxygenase [Bradyrhizobium sp. NBAIM02]